MDRNQQKKLLLGVGTIGLLLLMMLGALAYHQSPQNSQKETTTTPIQPSFPIGDQSILPSPNHPLALEDKGATTTPPHLLQALDLCAVHVNNIYSAVFLGIFAWRLYIKSSIIPGGHKKTLVKPSMLLCLIAALVGYMVCFYYQNYVPLDHLSPNSLPKDIGLIALMGVFTGVIFVTMAEPMVTTSEKYLKTWQSSLDQEKDNLIDQKDKQQLEIKNNKKKQQHTEKNIENLNINKGLMEQWNSAQKATKTQDGTPLLDGYIKSWADIKKKVQNHLKILNQNYTKAARNLKNFWSLKKKIDALNTPGVVKIFISCSSMLVAYIIAVRVIEYFKSNHQIKRRKLDHMRLFSILILTGLWCVLVDKPTSHIANMLLWTIPACFLYVQAFWSPKLFASGYKKIGITIAAWLFHSSHLWEGLVAIPLTYLLSFSVDKIDSAVYKTFSFWGVWACCKWGLLYAFYYWKRKKAYAKEGAIR